MKLLKNYLTDPILSSNRSSAMLQILNPYYYQLRDELFRVIHLTCRALISEINESITNMR